ncbi:hypothetical protein DL771_004966 [Monosporascus sp. 5C6A]|nr:hypothetical protein DL771_004966 [Monosporascus sp. 5C6A]
MPATSNGGLIRTFYDWAAAYSKDAASRLLSKLLMQASKIKKDAVQEILLPLMEEVLLSVDTGSLKVQYCFQLLVKASTEKSVAKEPPKPVNWARPAETFDYYDYLKAEKVGTEVGKVRFTKTLKWWEKRHRVWELDYGALMALDLVRVDGGKGGVGQSPDKTEPALPICPRVEQADDTRCAGILKRARHDEVTES